MASRSRPLGRAESWKLHEAKARFSELFRRVHDEGPQRVVRQGGDAVVVLTAEDFDRLSHRTSQPDRLVDFFRSAPTGGTKLSLDRKRDRTRSIKW